MAVATKPARPRVVGASEVQELKALARRGDYDELIGTLREQVDADVRTLTNAWVKQWCGQRWRDLFLREAAADPKALRAAATMIDVAGIPIPQVRVGKDKRPPRQRIAQRFLARDQDDWRLELPAPVAPKPTASMLFAPGFFHAAIPLHALAPEFADLQETYGMRTLRAQTHAFRGASANVADLVRALEAGRGADASGVPLARARKPGDVTILGYSKGAVDALALLIERPDLAPRVRSLTTWAGAVGGSPTADDVYGMIKDLRVSLGPASPILATLIKVMLPIARMDGLSERLDEWDFKAAVRDLTTTERTRFMRQSGRAIDAMNIPIFSIAAACSPLEVPYFQVQGALEISKRVGENDMQVAVRDAVVKLPMGTTLAVCRAHHWDLAMDSFPVHLRMNSANLVHRFPRRAAIRATVQLQSELGLLN
jgi:hypothetical protein